MQGTSAIASVPVRSSNTTENLANNFISTTAADFSTYTSTYGLSTFDLDAPQRYSFAPLPGTNRAMDQTVNGVITTSTTDFRSVSPSANPCTFNFRAPLRYNFSPPPDSNENHIWNDNSRLEAQMSTGNNRYGLLTTSIANSPATTSEQFVTNHFNDHHRTILQSHEQQRNSLFDNEQRQITNHTTSHPTTAINYSLKGFKLPDIKLQKFDGNPLEWNNWFELFQTAIGNNPRLSPVEKITYLQSLCTDNAKSLIESYGTNSSQYEQAIIELVRRYGNPKYVVSAFIRELEKFDKLILSEPQGFIRYAAFLRKLIHNFDLNGYTADLNSSNLTRLARSKLPVTLLMKWEEHCVLHDLDYATLKDLTQYLNNYSRACENLDIGPSTPNQAGRNRQPMKQQQTDSRPNQFTSMSRQNYDKSSGISARPTTLTCPIDNQVHYVGKCPDFLKLPVDQRPELVKQHKLCFNCLGQHRFSECTSSKRCFINNCGGKHHSTLHIDKKRECTSSKRCFINNCGGKHHSTLHIDKKPFQTHNQKSNNMQLGTTVTKPSEQAQDPIQNMNNIRNQLQFMPVTLFNNGIKLDCYAILDNCSSCSYILSKTAETLQCKPSQQLQLSVRGAFSKDKVSSSLVWLSIGPHNPTTPTFTLQSVYSVEALSFDAIDANNLNKTCSL